MEVTNGTYYATGNQLCASSGFSPSFFEKGYSVYEVIRIINGRALFLEEHLGRLSESVRLSGYADSYGQAGIPATLLQLALSCGKPNGNVKIVVHFPESGTPATYAFFIPHAYPSEVDYRDGVKTALLRSMRLEPNIKSMSSRIGTSFLADEDQAVYDVLLVDELNRITEGSKSNVFFISGKIIYTAPDEMVLKGITRQKVISIIRSLNYKLIKNPVAINRLSDMDAAFLTGTSPKVMPLRAIDAFFYKVDHPFMRRIMQEYDRMIRDYLL